MFTQCPPISNIKYLLLSSSECLSFAIFFSNSMSNSPVNIKVEYCGLILFFLHLFSSHSDDYISLFMPIFNISVGLDSLF